MYSRGDIGIARGLSHILAAWWIAIEHKNYMKTGSGHSGIHMLKLGIVRSWFMT